MITVKRNPPLSALWRYRELCRKVDVIVLKATAWFLQLSATYFLHWRVLKRYCIVSWSCRYLYSTSVASYYFFNIISVYVYRYKLHAENLFGIYDKQVLTVRPHYKICFWYNASKIFTSWECVYHLMTYFSVKYSFGVLEWLVLIIMTILFSLSHKDIDLEKPKMLIVFRDVKSQT